MGTVKASYTDDIKPDANAQSELSSAVKEAWAGRLFTGRGQ